MVHYLFTYVLPLESQLGARHFTYYVVDVNRLAATNSDNHNKARVSILYIKDIDRVCTVYSVRNRLST
jgi:hypothetical protein